MPFSAVTCLTYTGTTTLGGTLNLYSDVDSFNSPFQSSINLSAITGNECPYYISNVPDGTTQIRIFDIVTGCYCDIPIESNDLCVSCDLDFNVYSASTVGRIVAGDLTGLCDPSITDYRIYWYNTGDTTTPIFTSGLGTEYQPYSFTHPLTGSSAIFAPAGTYIPIIDKIKLSGLTFSQTGGTGNIPAELDCFTATTVTVNYFTCDNGDGSSNDANYEHRVQFSGAAAGVTPQSLFSDFLFTGTSSYFAWKFCGFAVEDRLRLTYSGSAYSEPIIIEDIVIGSNLSTSNFNLNNLPKSADTLSSNNYIKKVSCLTGLTRNINDTLRLEVIPNSANTQTNWDFYFQCLDTFDQNTCIITNNPYKISASTINSITGSCNTNNINYYVSACTRNSDDFSKYIVNDNDGSIMNGTNYSIFNLYNPSGIRLLFTGNMTINSPVFSNTQVKDTSPQTCSTPNTNTIEYKKYVSGGTIGVIDMTFNTISDLDHYYNGYLSIISGSSTLVGGCATSTGAWSGTPNDPTDIRYYRYFTLGIPNNTGSTNCGDGTTTLLYNIHPSSVVTTGTSGPNYTMRLTMPTIVNSITDPCITAGTVGSYVNVINLSSTGTSNNFTGTTLTGSKYTDPFYKFSIGCSGVTSVSAVTAQGFFDYPKYFNETIPYTGLTPTIVPSLSAKTFNFDTSGFTFFNLSNNRGYYRAFSYSYLTVLNNPSDFRDFEIYANQYSGGTVGSFLLIYSYTGATSASTIHDPSYFI